jgi:hypothetical protein
MIDLSFESGDFFMTNCIFTKRNSILEKQKQKKEINTNFSRLVLLISFMNKDGSRSSTNLSFVANKRFARSSNVLEQSIEDILISIRIEFLPSAFHSKS